MADYVQGHVDKRKAALAKTARADAAVAATLQAEVWQQPLPSAASVPSFASLSSAGRAGSDSAASFSRADGVVAASLQAEAWREATPAMAAQVEAWQVCSMLVCRDSRATPCALGPPSSRPITVRRPAQSEVTTAEGRLHAEVARYGLRARAILGDGACQFRAVADQLYRDQNLHQAVRQRALTQLRSGRSTYSGFAVGEGFEDYLNRMMALDAWGDNLTLQAVADAFDIEVCLVTSFSDRNFICIPPVSGRPSQQIWLGFFAEYHYTSLEPSA